MEPETSPSGPSTGGISSDGPAAGAGSGSGTAAAAAKRSRVLLSCGPCRASKLKCDRSQPCGQCLKKSRPDGCVYAPKPEKQKPTKGMAARLKRLEGMVRTMMDEGGGTQGGVAAAAAAAAAEVKDVAQPGGQIVQGERGTTYVGATHFMAILEDIEDMKSYFEEPEMEEAESPELLEEADSPDVLLGTSRNMSREELLRLLPERKVMDRLIMRYFSSQSPSQHIIHRPTFVKEYAQFWNDPYGTSIHWLALLFMVMSLAVFYSTFLAPHELSGDSPSQPPMDRFRTYRAAAACCLVRGRFNTQPTIATIPPFILYVEAEFIISRAAQMNCYVLSSVCLRLLLKMGLHRDPSVLANVTPFEGEMRRRMWNMAVQLDLLVSFHMGLPSMLSGIDWDCGLPRNLIDEDFSEDSPELPTPRPATDYTEMTYPISKSRMMHVFGRIARQAHLLSPPPYTEVMRLDALLEEAWHNVPSFMMIKPLEHCVTTPPMQVIQRFGLASLYNKSRCVLHRRFLLEPVPRREHDYSRRQCLEGAVMLLEFQDQIWRACQPGGMLSTNGWFVSSLAVHDFLLAAIILYLAVGNEQFWQEGGAGGEWLDSMSPRPTRESLLNILQRSYGVWENIAGDVPEVKKTADVLETMLSKLGSPPNSPPKDESGQAPASMSKARSDGSASDATSGHDSQLLTGLSLSDSSSFPTNQFQPLDFVTPGLPSDSGLDRGWIAVSNEMDWRYFDNIVAQTSADPMAALDESQPWFDRGPAPDDFGFSAAGGWDLTLGRPC